MSRHGAAADAGEGARVPADPGAGGEEAPASGFAHLERLTQAPACPGLPDGVVLRRPDAAPADGGAPVPVSFGRHPANDVVLDSPEIPLLASRYHARIAYSVQGRTYSITDANTTNGTYVNSQPIPKGGSCTLADGDIISFGGPASVVREGIHLRNPFRFRFTDDQPELQSEAQPETRGNTATVPAAANAAEPGGGPADSSIAGLAGRKRSRQELYGPGADAADAAQARRRSLSRPGAAGGSEPETQPLTQPATQPLTQPPAFDAPPTTKKVIVIDDDGTCKEEEERIVDHAREKPVKVPQALLASLDEHLKCIICHEYLLQPMSLSCGHCFCSDCVTNWINSRPSPSCPMCRQLVTSAPMPNRNLAGLICALAESSMNAEELDERAEKVKRAEARAAEAKEARKKMLERIGFATPHAAVAAVRSRRSAAAQDAGGGAGASRDDNARPLSQMMRLIQDGERPGETESEVALNISPALIELQRQLQQQTQRLLAQSRMMRDRLQTAGTQGVPRSRSSPADAADVPSPAPPLLEVDNGAIGDMLPRNVSAPADEGGLGGPMGAVRELMRDANSLRRALNARGMRTTTPRNQPRSTLQERTQRASHILESAVAAVARPEPAAEPGS